MKVAAEVAICYSIYLQNREREGEIGEQGIAQGYGDRTYSAQARSSAADKGRETDNDKLRSVSASLRFRRDSECWHDFSVRVSRKRHPLTFQRHGCQMAKFDPFLSLDCARVEGVGAQSKERKGSNFAA